MGVRHTGHPRPIAVTVSAQVLQNLACPHGTSATPERGAIRYTSHNSSGSEVDDVTVDAAAAEASAAGGEVAAVGCCSWIRHQQIVEVHDEMCNKQTGLQA